MSVSKHNFWELSVFEFIIIRLLMHLKLVEDAKVLMCSFARTLKTLTSENIVASFGLGFGC